MLQSETWENTFNYMDVNVSFNLFLNTFFNNFLNMLSNAICKK
jgi:hypothetical protein